ncbi:P-loop NTPase family protein [Desulfogranum mediterraneum]|uniref:hypothetical protein n=1 Tax=Desulfogranum mediterraneum TaxID=160661 RepID=UPI00040FCEA5|nr:hypothetical protein [Desulfogranum mediterraneum]
MHPANQQHHHTIPELILIVGTDAAGKDHLARIVEEMILEAGYPVEKRKRLLCGKLTREHSSSAKSWFELCLEKAFIRCFPSARRWLPWLLTLLLRRDIRRFSHPQKKVVIVGHNYLRGLALSWGHPAHSQWPRHISPLLEQTLAEMRALPGFHAIVLDVDDAIRKKRISRRLALGEADNFDCYMAEDRERSERIEEILVQLVKDHLGGQLIRNNDLTEKELRTLLSQGFARSNKSS